MSTDPLQLIMEERARQDKKWGEQNHGDLYWLGILMEEVGETAEAIIVGDDKQIGKELTQTAAVELAWIERRERGRAPKLTYCDKKGGKGYRSDILRLGAFAMGVGRIAKAVIEFKDDEVEKELTRIETAVAIWLKAMARRRTHEKSNA